MSKLTPNSKFKLYKGVDIDRDVTLAFSSPNAREAYFGRHLVKEFTTQIIKKTGQIKVPLKQLNGVQLEECNYMSFINPHYDNKLYYARVYDHDYINNEVGVVRYAIDEWLTNMFNVSYRSHLIDREHVSATEWRRLQANPYDQSVAEMRTPEHSLVVSEDVQKKNYQIGNDKDAYMLGKKYTLTGQPTHDDAIYYNVVFISPTNFTAFNRDIGLEENMFEYWQALLKTFGQDEQMGARNGLGFLFAPDKSIANSTGLLPTGVWANRMSHPYWILGFYMNADGSYQDDIYNLPNLLDHMTQSNIQDAVMAIYSIPYALLKFMVGYGDFQSYIPFPAVINDNGASVVKSDFAGADPKLFQFPFAYLKLTTPDGQSKELKYEEFQKNINSNGGEVLALGGDMSEKPKFIVQPDDYKYRNGGYGNPLEAVVIDSFPTVPYTIDAWTAQMAAMSAQAVSAYTLENAQALYYSETFQTGTVGRINRILQMGADVAPSVSADGSGVNVSVPGPSQVSGAVGGFLSSSNQMIIQEIRNQEFRDAGSYLAGQRADNSIENNYRMTRPAYAVDIYNKSNGDGVINYNKTGFLDVLLTHVRLNENILRLYTQYFDEFGYTSKRLGIPHVIGYTQGSDEPAWRTVNGRKQTFVKTINAKVISHDQVTSDSIASMLNAGVTMLKGDDLP